ncbi:COR domain-containing protein [Acidobacteriota bacterium]
MIIYDLEFVRQLEKKTGITLMRLSLEKINKNGVTGFAVDDNGRVRSLAISNKKLRRLPALLSKFQRLEKLVLNNNQISDISNLNELKGLMYLDLRSNRINDISSLKELKELTKLGLQNNQISDISSLNELKGLTVLVLVNNQINDISSLNELKNLKYVLLMDNKITHMPAEFIDLGLAIKWEYDEGEGIFLEDNPLESPPAEIIKKGKKAIKQYFKSLAGDEQALNEVKVLLVGDGATGKTSLAKALLGQPFDIKESQTHGININTMEINVNNTIIKLRLWDFGGQEIMHATHRFFLSNRSLYILVLDGRKDEKTEYWLNHIESFGGDSPVMVVLNKIDENPGFDVNRKFLQEKYRGIKGFYRVSCASGDGIEEFTNDLNKTVDSVEIKATRWGSAWFNVKQRLENMEEDFISYKEYRQLCNEAKVPDDPGRKTLVEFLNDLGVIVHFKDLELNDTHILQPRWVTEAVYKIINSPRLASGKGVLAPDHLPDILKKKKDEDFYYPPEKYRFIIGLMRKFELCYQLGDGRLLVPDLLETNEPDFEFENKGALGFIVQYNFLPPSVMPRFIVKMHRDIHNRLQWRTGVVLRDRDFRSTAVVKADNEAKCIYFHVNGPQKREYFAVLLTVLRRINHDYQKLDTTELVPLPDDPGITADYKQLIRHEQHGIPVYLPGNSDREYNVKDLLGAFAIDKRSEEDILKLIRKAIREEDGGETALEKVNETLLEVISFRPKILGVEFDVNALLKKLRGKKKAKPKTLAHETHEKHEKKTKK